VCGHAQCRRLICPPLVLLGHPIAFLFLLLERLILHLIAETSGASFVLVEGALRSPDPPHSIPKVIAGVTVFMAFFRSRQVRRQDDVAAREKEVDEELR
jgi:hypothetical protein